MHEVEMKIIPKVFLKDILTNFSPFFGHMGAAEQAENTTLTYYHHINPH